MTDQISIDLLSDEATRDPNPLWKAARQQCPVHFSDSYNMWWNTEHELEVAVFEDPSQWLNALAPRAPYFFLCDAARDILATRMSVVPTLTTADAPQQPASRKPIQRELTVRKIRALLPGVENIARSLLSSFHASGSADFVAQFTHPLPLLVLAEFLGVPEEDRAYFQEMGDWMQLGMSTALRGLSEAEQVEFARQMVKSDEYLLGLIHARQAEPKDDFISRLVQMERTDGRLFTEPELLDIMQMLSLGGHETSSNALGSMFLYLAQHQELQEEMRSDPELIDLFIEETLRYSPPVIYRTRTAAADAELGGCPVKAGQVVANSLASANFDPEFFENPDEFNPRRPNVSQHLTFGKGVHHCMGSEIARAEMRISLKLALASMDDIRLAEPAEKAYSWKRHSLLRGPAEVHLTWTPKPLPTSIVEG